MTHLRPLIIAALLAAMLALAARSAPAPQTGSGAAGDELGTFVPSETVPADSAVSFPVDI